MKKLSSVNHPYRWLIIPILIICAVTVGLDSQEHLFYPIRKLPKIIFFVLLPVWVALKAGGMEGLKKDFFHWTGKYPLLIGTAIFCILLALALVLQINIKIPDLELLSQKLYDSARGKIWLFLLGAVYISTINSLMEELFFRYLAFSKIKTYWGRTFAYLFSSFLFSIYHITILIKWCESLWLIIVLLIILFVAGGVLCRIQEKYSSVMASWVVHAFANIGMMAFAFIILVNSL